MSTEENTKETLLEKIQDKRGEIRKFLKRAEPRNMRFINIAIITSALAAALTAGSLKI